MVQSLTEPRASLNELDGISSYEVIGNRALHEAHAWVDADEALKDLWTQKESFVQLQFWFSFALWSFSCTAAVCSSTSTSEYRTPHL
jgi:hypothetical protein